MRCDVEDNIGTMPITATDIQRMVSHWLGCPPNGYLGSGFGSSVQDLLMTPLSSGLADSVLDKLRQDIPIISQLPPGAVNLYYQENGPDKLKLFIEVLGSLVVVPPGFVERANMIGAPAAELPVEPSGSVEFTFEPPDYSPNQFASQGVILEGNPALQSGYFGDEVVGPTTDGSYYLARYGNGSYVFDIADGKILTKLDFIKSMGSDSFVIDYLSATGASIVTTTVAAGTGANYWQWNAVSIDLSVYSHYAGWPIRKVVFKTLPVAVLAIDKIKFTF